MTKKATTINVTERIIASAQRKSSSHCMIADAIRTEFPDATHVAVDLQTMSWSDKHTNLRYWYLTPRAVQQYLIDFDQGIDPAPFTFRLPAAPMQVLPRRGPKGAATLRTNGKSQVTTKLGGQAPPRSNIGRRREFGLKAMSR